MLHSDFVQLDTCITVILCLFSTILHYLPRQIQPEKNLPALIKMNNISYIYTGI